MSDRTDQHWTPAELQALQRLVLAGASDRVAALELGRTASGVRHARRHRLCIIGKASERLDIDTELRAVWATSERPSDHDLGTRLGCSAQCVKKHRIALGLTRRRTWTNTEEAMLEQMWRAGSTDAEFIEAAAARWSTRVRLTIPQVREHRARLGLTRCHRGKRLRDYSTNALVNELRRRGAEHRERVAAMTVGALVEELRRRGKTVIISKAKP